MVDSGVSQEQQQSLHPSAVAAPITLHPKALMIDMRVGFKVSARGGGSEPSAVAKWDLQGAQLVVAVRQQSWGPCPYIP
jgi:hypothetical protein